METKTFPASRLQASLFHKYAADPHSTDSNLAFGFRARTLDVTRLEYALNQIIARHEQLRTNFYEADGTIYQTIHPARTITVASFSGKNLRAFLRPFDMTHDILVRAAVQKNVVLLDFCHIITDGFSMAIFFRELNALYNGETLSSAAPSVRDCLVPDQTFCANEPYWLKLLQKPCAPLSLPTDFSSSRMYGGAGNSVMAHIGAQTKAAVQTVCKRLSITPFVFYLSAFCLFMARHCDTDDVLIGTIFSCRNSRNLRSIGLYTTIAPVRVTVPVTANATVSARDAFLLQMNAHIRQSLTHQQMDIDSILAQKGLRDMRDLFRTVFTFEDARMADIRLGGAPCEFVPVPTKDSAFDVNICFFPFKTESRLLMIYRSDLYRAQTAVRYLDEYTEMIAEMALDIP